jgi:hypothetical protein
VREPHEDMVLMDLAELDEMAREAWQVLRRPHLIVSQGRVAKHPDTGEPLHDDGPLLAAIGKLLDIQARRAKLVGMDAPTKSSVQVITKDAFTADLERMAAELVVAVSLRRYSASAVRPRIASDSGTDGNAWSSPVGTRPSSPATPRYRASGARSSRQPNGSYRGFGGRLGAGSGRWVSTCAAGALRALASDRAPTDRGQASNR